MKAKPRPQYTQKRDFRSRCTRLPTLLIGLLLCSSCQIATPPPAEADKKQLYNSRNATTFTQHCQRIATALEKRLEQLSQFELPPTVENYLRPLDSFSSDLDNHYNIAQLYSNTHPDSTMRDSATDCQQDLAGIFSRSQLSPAIYRRLQAIALPQNLPATQRHHDKLLRDMRRNGVDQSKSEREAIDRLNKKIAALGQQFAKNIRQDTRSITLHSADELAGLPQDYREKLPRNSEGQWEVSTDYPSLFPFLRYAQSDDRRRELYWQFLNRGYPENEAVLKELIETRHALAKQLGYRNYASYATEQAMIATPQQAAAFIDRIAELAAPRAASDYQQLLQQLRKTTPTAKLVGSWQKAFLGEQVKQQHYNLDAKALRQYFAYDAVKAGVFSLVEQLFAVKILPWQTAVWHPSVSSHELRDEAGNTLGYFYLDMHPREGKYQHAAHFGLESGVLGRQLPVSALICNFPAGEPSRADRGLMEHRQVETFLHEFGHLMHSLLGGQQPWSSLSGIATERDFVEAPSQLLEEWAWDYDTLKTFAVNADGETIPRELVDKMQRARSFAKGTHIRNQMFYAALSLSYYNTPPQQLDINRDMIALQQRYSPFDHLEGTHFFANFGHLYGYSARYYTYMWSQVIAADLFAEFQREGLRNRDTAARYRDTVLAPGGKKDAAQLIEDFLGRPFNYDAFIEQLEHSE